jgi:hypothetical protein
MNDYCACNPDDPACLPLWKSASATEGDRVVEGLASIDIRDEQDEIVHPDKLDFSYLTKKGKLNYDHGRDPADQLGTILDYKVGRVRDIVPAKYHNRVRKFLDNCGLWVKARLKRGLKKAEDVWTDLSSNPDEHGYGFSVQGRAQRSGQHVVAGTVTAVALTPSPVLAETFAVLAKALGTSYARQDQVGGQAAVREDLRDHIVSTTYRGSPYGDNPPGGYIGTADSIVGYRRVVGADDRVRREPVTRSVLLPRGEPVPAPVDAHSAKHALKSFLRFVRSLGPQRGNVLDGTMGYFQMMHGLDSTTARALSQYVREHSDTLFAKCFLSEPRKPLAPRTQRPSAPAPSRPRKLDARETKPEKRTNHHRGRPPQKGTARMNNTELLEKSLAELETGDAAPVELDVSEDMVTLNETIAKSLNSGDAAELRKGLRAAGNIVSDIVKRAGLAKSSTGQPARRRGQHRIEDASPEDRATLGRLLVKGFLSPAIGDQLLDGTIDAAEAIELVKAENGIGSELEREPTATEKRAWTIALRAKKVSTTLALAVDRNQITIPQALSVIGKKDIVNEWLAMLQTGTAEPMVVDAVHRGEMSITEAIDMVKRGQVVTGEPDRQVGRVAAMFRDI